MRGGTAGRVVHITARQRRQLAEAIFAAFPDWGAFDSLVHNGLGVEPHRVAGRQTVRVAIDELIEWGRSHTALKKLIEAARMLNPDNDALAAIAEELAGLEGTIPTAPDPFEVCLIGRQPFIDRARLRRFLKELTASNGSKVLQVEGEAESGKSYSWRLIQYVSREVMPAKHAVPIDLQPEDTPTTLLQEILSRVGSPGEIPPPGGEAIGIWMRRVCGHTVREMRKALQQREVPECDQIWIVLDFPQAGIAQQVRDVVYRLAKEINDSHDFRLILLGFPERLRGLEPEPLHEAIPPLDRLQLSSYFHDLRDQYGKTAEPTVIDRLLDGVLAYANGSGTGYTRKLNTAVAKTVELLLETEQ